ncbi:hypothetical protein LOTGIDRAFT_232426 [Lottia gigantea]|uniref:Antistasin-like domain-containing protein n=1 Tax=Lottia gigantea TaxID=225164 RepID=V4AKR1_LOTGI|nr:hypothetical protein LOTGIDRAFT_232426 [Lottia gigantea]ESO94161.1 hypothetical protein LOTGIDRAFT_232426 [Lottia gigantea]
MKFLIIFAVVVVAAYVDAQGDCPVRACQTRLCYTGRIKDAQGCDTCDCCPEMMCMNYCPFGRKIKANGCPSCQCKDFSDCSPVRCRMNCRPWGYKRGPDGCEICQCNFPGVN